MKKILWTFSALGTAGVVFAPIASVVSCDRENNKFSSATIKESTKDNETILNEMARSLYTSSILKREADVLPVIKDIIDSYDKTSFNYSLDPNGWGTPEQVEAAKNAREGVEKIWNKPQGEVVRLAHVTAMMGQIMWKIEPSIPASDAVILGITQGINATGAPAAEKLNLFKLELINNIRAAFDATGARESLKKFEGFIEWMTNPENEYANLRLTLMGGIINNDFMYGVQTAMNFYPDSKAFIEPFKIENKQALKVSTLTPEQTQWITNIQKSKELAAIATSKQPAIQAIFADSDKSRVDFANFLLGPAGPGMRTAIVSAAIGSIWKIPGDVSVKRLKPGVISAIGVGPAAKLEEHITEVEKTHLGSLAEFIKFIEDLKSPTNKYEFFKKLLAEAGAKDDQIKSIQNLLNNGKDLDGDKQITEDDIEPILPKGETPVDIYA